MEKHELNFAGSQRVYKSAPRKFAAKDCYHNIFRLMQMEEYNFRHGTWKIAYGYMRSIENVYVRHCFVLDQNGLVIDPTLFTHTEKSELPHYYVFAVFNRMEEYLSALESDHYNPALKSYLREYDVCATMWGIEQGLAFIG